MAYTEHLSSESQTSVLVSFWTHQMVQAHLAKRFQMQWHTFWALNFPSNIFERKTQSTTMALRGISWTCFWMEQLTECNLWVSSKDTCLAWIVIRSFKRTMIDSLILCLSYINPFFFFFIAHYNGYLMAVCWACVFSSTHTQSRSLMESIFSHCGIFRLTLIMIRLPGVCASFC